MMSNPMGPAAAEGVPAAATPTRRAVLRGSAAVAGLVASAGAALAAIPSWMELRIEAHRDAGAALTRAGEELELVTRLLNESLAARPIAVTVECDKHLGPKTIDFTGSQNQILDEIAGDLTGGRHWPFHQLSRRAVADLAADMMERKARHDRNMEALAAAERELAARRERLGYPEATARWNAACDREIEALDALIRERPRSLADVEARSRYLSGALVERLEEDGPRLAALLASMTGREG